MKQRDVGVGGLTMHLVGKCSLLCKVISWLHVQNEKSWHVVGIQLNFGEWMDQGTRNEHSPC